MKTHLHHLLFTFVLLTNSSMSTADDPLDDFIQQACYNEPAEYTTWIDKHFSFNSLFCQQAREQGPTFDFDTAVEKNNIRLTQEDLDRIYSQGYLEKKLPSKIEQECTYNTPGKPVGVDMHCTAVREELAKQNINMSLTNYQRIEQDCDHHRECINNWKEKWQQGDKALPPKAKVGSIGFDDLISSPTPKPTPVNTSPTMSFDDLMGGNQTPTSPASTLTVVNPATAANSADSGETGFDNIYSSRDTIRINGIKQNLFDKNEIIASRCQCAFNQTSCFTSNQYDYGQLNEVMSKTDANYESEMDQVCMTWNSNLKGLTSDSERLLNRYLANSDIILGNINKLDSGYAVTKSKLDDKNYEIAASIAYQQQQQQAQQQANSGFNWGKFAALGAGLAIGGSMGDLGGSEMMNLMGNAALDSMEGVEGISNINSGMEEMTQIYDEHLDTMADIQQQSDDINAVNLANQRINSAPIQQAAPQQQQSSYEDLLPSATAKKNPASLDPNCYTTVHGDLAYADCRRGDALKAADVANHPQYSPTTTLSPNKLPPY